MSRIDYKAIYNLNKDDWRAVTREPQKHEALLAGHYSDRNHFVYELLQNAEDAFSLSRDSQTCKVVIEYYSDRLVFYHNGKPFDEADVQGVASMLMGTKSRDDAQTIGRFGMGFKSVYKYTYQPEIYSDCEAFRIVNYLLPEEIKEGWDFEREKKTVVCKPGEINAYMPFLGEKHLTKFVIPFKKLDIDGEIIDISGEGVLAKLQELNSETLLFLNYINDLYWVNKENGNYSHIRLNRDEDDECLVTCHIVCKGYDKTSETSNYLLFKKTFDHPEMRSAEVSVAYRMNSHADNINEVDESPIFVYFPTRDNTNFPFLIHGSFETAVSREKLMSPSQFNDDLFDELGNLIAESMVDLSNRKLLTQMFIRRIILTAFEDEENNGTINGLRDKINKTIIKKGLLPDKNGVGRHVGELLIPLPFQMSEFADKSIVGELLPKSKHFIALNNERELNFNNYYKWLTDDIGIKSYKLSDLAKEWKELLDSPNINVSDEDVKVIKQFYDFLSDIECSRGGAYEIELRKDLSVAWDYLREAPIILNRIGQLVPSIKDGMPNVYLNASSKYKSIAQDALVDISVARDYEALLVRQLRIQEFDNFQYIKERIIQKYIEPNNDSYSKQCNYSEDEYIQDIKRIITLIDEGGRTYEILEILSDAYIIKVNAEMGESDDIYAKPNHCYISVSEEGIDLRVYYSPIPDEYIHDVEDSDCWYDFDVYSIDAGYYEANGISELDLSKLGLITTPVNEGSKKADGIGDEHWVALGEYCPNISVDGLRNNLEYIESYPDEELAKKKSVEILKLLIAIAPKLSGRKKKRKNNPYTGELEEVAILYRYIRPIEWLYDQSYNLDCPKEMSRYDLNNELYATIDGSKEAYKILGFVSKDVDRKVEAISQASKLSEDGKKQLIELLASQLGLYVSDNASDMGNVDSPAKKYFEYDSIIDDEFPAHQVKNIDYLTRHVREQFYLADPVSYEKVLRQIRTSKNANVNRSYAIGMYTNYSNTVICQMCKKPANHIEITELANFGIEMSQLNLCLCRDCHAKYIEFRDNDKEEFKDKIETDIMSMDIDSDRDEYVVELDEEYDIYFTQTHIAEIQEIFRLIEKYGIPNNNYK